MSAPKNDNKILKIFKGDVNDYELDEEFLPEEVDDIVTSGDEQEVKIVVKKKQELLENKFKEDDRSKDKKKPNEKK